MWKPAQKLWEAIKGNVYFWIISFVCSSLGGSAALTSIWKHIQEYRGMPVPDSKGIYLLCMLISCLVILSWIAARLEVKFRTASQFRDKLPVHPPVHDLRPSTVPKQLEPPLVRPVDLRGQILEIYFNDLPFEQPLLFYPMRIICKASIVNHGPDQTTITGCALYIKLGDFERLAESADVPTSWQIKRKETGTLGPIYNNTTIGPELTQNDTYPKGIPRTGWLAFELSNWGDSPEFHNAEFRLILKDSFGGSHHIVRPSQVYERIGELVWSSTSALKP
jgi:hypothetical protein